MVVDQVNPGILEWKGWIIDYKAKWFFHDISGLPVVHKKAALNGFQAAGFITSSLAPLSYAGISRIRFEGSDSRESSQFR